MYEVIVNAIPGFIRDLIRGTSVGLAVTLPFVVLWLAFAHTKTFKLEYMKEISLLIVWIISLAHLLPLKIFKVGKDGVHVEFRSEPVKPEDAIS